MKTYTAEDFKRWGAQGGAKSKRVADAGVTGLVAGQGELAEPSGSAMADAEAEQVAWEWFSGAHPHEAHAKWPDRFWRFFQSRCPGVTREQMERTLSETDESPNGKLTDGGPVSTDFK